MAHELARALEADHPAEVISCMQKARRVGTVFIDWSRNNGLEHVENLFCGRGSVQAELI
ncbi:non-homologous end-joining DNA ligase LigD [Leifsonia poae]|uniref:non-homologous end-joining DNA ligase LigD n=1 Tax=Leifsonia poae TaxID=110933 RepID=UPI001CC15CE5|nr:hypothetical protein [Leifsonia poae]